MGYTYFLWHGSGHEMRCESPHRPFASGDPTGLSGTDFSAADGEQIIQDDNYG